MKSLMVVSCIHMMAYEYISCPVDGHETQYMHDV